MNGMKSDAGESGVDGRSAGFTTSADTSCIVLCAKLTWWAEDDTGNAASGHWVAIRVVVKLQDKTLFNVGDPKHELG